MILTKAGDVLQHIANGLWALARLGHQGCRSLLPGIALRVLELWSEFQPAVAICILESFALLQALPFHLWAQLLSNLTRLDINSLMGPTLQHIYHTYLLLQAAGEPYDQITLA